jgi:hypothetical protein
VSYTGLIRDARNEELMQSTRMHAAFDAIYCCCQPRATLDETLESLELSIDDARRLLSLREWVKHVAPLGPLPLSPSEAVALAERVHNNG